MAITLVWAISGALFLAFPQGVYEPVSYADSKKPESTLTVATFNTEAKITSADIEYLRKKYDPDIVVFPESADNQIRSLLQDAGFSGEVYGAPDSGLSAAYVGDIPPTSLLVNSRLGSAHLINGPETTFGTVTLDFDNPELPTVVGVHAAPPLSGLRQAWATDLERVISYGENAATSTIIAGDFNATLRHGRLAKRATIIDAAHACGHWAGTWPTKLPQTLRSPIDHIFVTPDLSATHCTTDDIGASDHAVFIATIA